MKIVSLFFLISTLFLIAGNCHPQEGSNPSIDLLYQYYSQFKEESIETKRFKHEDILPLIQQVEGNSLFRVQQVGLSIEEMPLYLISVGEGETDIFYWSQMHGDESTATAAIFDVLNFLQNPGEELADFRDNLLENTTLHFLPMLNPDGAEFFSRRNAINIDINRDALRLASPESVALKQVRDSLNPKFGFNLHDQSTFYTAGRDENPATISFLAPAYDYEQSINPVRRNAMKLTVYLNSVLQKFIPGQVAKYSDEHEPRAFGDNIQKWGTSTILIESGGYPDDPEKQFIRRLNFILLLTAADAIGKDTFQEESIEEYFDIPENQSFLHDLVIRNVRIEKNDRFFDIDFGIRYRENPVENHRSYRYRARIDDIGDLSIYHGYQEVDGNGLIATPGIVYEETLQSVDQLKQLDASDLLRNGYTDVALNLNQSGIGEAENEFLQSFPLNLHLRGAQENRIGLGVIPNLVLRDQNEQVRYVIVNGFVYDVEMDNTQSITNAVIFR